MESLNKNKRKHKSVEIQNCNKKIKAQLNKDNDMVKYIIKCTKNNTKLLEDLKYIYKSNEISDFSRRLKKYISKREKIEKEYNNKIFEDEQYEKEIENDKQYELSFNNKNNVLIRNNSIEENINNTLPSKNDNEKISIDNSINFIFTDNKKNLEEILIIKPINEINEIKNNYCQLDTTNKYIIKRIKKENFLEAYNNDPDFKIFLTSNHQIFENNNDNEIMNTEIIENQEAENSYNNENEILKNEKEKNIKQSIFYKNNKKLNDKFKNSHSRSENESNGKNI